MHVLGLDRGLLIFLCSRYFYSRPVSSRWSKECLKKPTKRPGFYDSRLFSYLSMLFLSLPSTLIFSPSCYSLKFTNSTDRISHPTKFRTLLPLEDHLICHLNHSRPIAYGFESQFKLTNCFISHRQSMLKRNARKWWKAIQQQYTWAIYLTIVTYGLGSCRNCNTRHGFTFICFDLRCHSVDILDHMNDCIMFKNFHQDLVQTIILSFACCFATVFMLLQEHLELRRPVLHFATC
ncbi:unnamed protein product [Albugo candida]|uniref:Uncharacterized protein n=1 Tax=Albugo candida TaxID=65357 RepID=A0A024GSQ1_9STRA|nr:unnamed protein product [Albugo candida]|eukprot:CCI49820.1 unnamed protein product [Albugo candida]